MQPAPTNIDHQTVRGFGEEWTAFDQSQLDDEELRNIFDGYFEIFPWNVLPPNAIGFDMGCGSGRWAKLVAPRVSKLYCIDPSRAALTVAKRNLKQFNNVTFVEASVDCVPLQDSSMDFGYCLGVLHHVPDTAMGIKACVGKLKPNAPLLIYLYYAFDNRPWWYRALWRLSDYARRVISRLPFPLKYATSQTIAVFVYYPLARVSLMLELAGLDVDTFPLSVYRRRSFHTMRTDALDRFGTRLEKRFTASEIQRMMEDAGLTHIRFGKTAFWCAVGHKKMVN